MARLVDMDNAAELDPEKAVSPAFVAKKRKTKDDPLHRRTVSLLQNTLFVDLLTICIGYLQIHRAFSCCRQCARLR